MGDTVKTNNKSIGLLVIFIVLLISNIVFFGLFISYFFSHHIKFTITFGMVNNVFAIVAAIIILGFISTRLPQFRNMGDSSIYEVGYLIIIGLLSMVVSFFNHSTGSENFLGPYIDVFKVLSILLILVIISAKSKAFKSIIHRKIGRKALIYCFIIFSILGCISSMYYIPVHDSMVTVRELIVMLSGLFAGPFVSIPVGIVSGSFRFLYGGATALPCTLSTISAGVIGGAIYVCNNGRFLKGLPSVILMFLYTGFSMLLIILMTPQSISIPYVTQIYPLMLFASILGIILFRMIIKEERSGKEISYEDLRIRELENTIDEYEDRLDRLEEDVGFLMSVNGYYDEEDGDE